MGKTIPRDRGARRGREPAGESSSPSRATVPDRFRLLPASRGASGSLGVCVATLGCFRFRLSVVVLATRGGAVALGR